MSTVESDDLLIKSQILISKFRKQREMALTQNKSQFKTTFNAKQCYEHKNTFVPKNILTDCDSYPQREKDNTLLNKFMHHKSLVQSIEDHDLKITKNYMRDISDTTHLSSSSESSIWSASSHSKIEMEKVDCGVMTDFSSGICTHENDITPVTSLRAPFSVRNSHTPREYMLETSQRSVFSTICTDFQAKDNNIITKVPTELYKEEKSLNNNDDFFSKSNEEDKMKAAWEYFEEEKILEKRITEQAEIMNYLDKEMETLVSKIQYESHKLDVMKRDKEEFKCRRYKIFNGLSKEIQLNLTERDKDLNEIIDMNTNHNVVSNGYFNNENVKDIEINNCELPISTLDSETVRNIINRIVSKEFCNSEDQIFDQILINPKFPAMQQTKTYAQENYDSCVLSDVMSIKDLKVTSSSNDNENKTSRTTLTSSMSIFNTSTRTNGSKPPKFKKRMKPAQSVDNIYQVADKCKMTPQKKTRSPSISGVRKNYLYSSSSSSGESIFDSAIQKK